MGFSSFNEVNDNDVASESAGDDKGMANDLEHQNVYGLEVVLVQWLASRSCPCIEGIQ